MKSAILKISNAVTMRWMKKLLLYFLVYIYLPSIHAQMPETSAYWNGKYFQECKLKNAKDKKVVKEPTLFFSVKHISTYGHALLDGLVSLYDILKTNNLLKTPINLCIPADLYTSRDQAFLNITKMLKDVFKINEIIFVKDKSDFIHKKNRVYFKRLLINEYVPFDENRVYFILYKTFPKSFEYIQRLREIGFRDNVVFQEPLPRENIVKDFVDFVAKAYKIDFPMIKNRILITARSNSRKILNLMELVSSLQQEGYDVKVVDFAKLTVREQIIEIMQSEYLLGTYGSNFANAIFLKPEAKVVILWSKYAKYFWSRRYCIIHSAFLPLGITLIEYDKSDYDPRDFYSEKTILESYFYRDGNTIKLKPEKINLDEIIKFPFGGMAELTNVDIYVEPEEIIYLLKNR